ncbi:hypothetical protein HYW20_00070 [Candidatus Woesearchaeota archaeon]|nr:hypothetical protein [Candidatus Woesearchaeota archaeon]
MARIWFMGLLLLTPPIFFMTAINLMAVTSVFACYGDYCGCGSYAQSKYYCFQA